MSTPSTHSSRLRSEGSTLLLALVTIAVLSTIAASVFSTLSLRYGAAMNSASWEEAALAAEAGADLAVAEVRRVLPQLKSMPADSWSGWTASNGTGPVALPTTQAIPAGVSLSVTPAALVHAGEGNTREQVTVVLDAPAGLALFNQQYLRVRSTGTTQVPARRRVSPAKRDNQLRRLNLVYDRAGQVTATPSATRAIELILRPVLPFQQAILSGSAVSIYDTLSYVDSFNSGSPSTSTGGLYDSAKRLQNGDVFANDPNFRIDGRIYGDVGTNGGTLASLGRITGTIDNHFQQSLTAVPVPAWSASIPTLSGGGSVTVAPGSLASPTRYKFGDLSGDLTISAGGTGQSSVEIWITGDLFGSITIASGVQAKIYVQGNVWMNAGSLDNRSHLAANLQIYGIQPPATESRYFGIGLGPDVYASVYAPAHEVMFFGTGHVMGAFVGRSVNAYGRTYLHYDEALMVSAGKTLDYKVASWIEVLR